MLMTTAWCHLLATNFCLLGAWNKKKCDIIASAPGKSLNAASKKINWKKSSRHSQLDSTLQVAGSVLIANGLCHHCVVPNFSRGRCWNLHFTQLKAEDIDLRHTDYHFGNSKTNILVWKNRFYNKNCASTKALKFTMYQSFDIFKIVKSVNKLFSWYIKSHETRVDTAIWKSRNNFSPKKKKCRITLKKVLFAIKCGT